MSAQVQLKTVENTIATGVSTDISHTILADVAKIAKTDLARLVHDIDLKGVYPESIMRALGRAGAYSRHAPMNAAAASAPDAFDLETAIQAMAIVSEQCLSTAFCVWCQDALAWYIANSENETLKQTLGPQIASGETLGGTGLSNPMKSLFGIEKFRLKGVVVDGGYEVTGTLPWVSNLGVDHHFGIVFALSGEADRKVMAVADCAGEGIKIIENDDFVALDGTRTFSIQMRKAFIPAESVLADSIDDYIPKIRAGFILLQSGMAFGMIRSCIALMEQAGQSLSHVNCHLPDQPDDFRQQLAAMEHEVFELARTPFDTSKEYFIRVIKARLAAGDASVEAAHNAMLHCGARGYVRRGTAQRRLREAYFIAIVTPATKQLRKMLADLGAA